MAEDRGVTPPEQPIDYDSAELFLRKAREAHQAGDHVQCLAARKLVAIALHLRDTPPAHIHTGHLRDK